MYSNCDAFTLNRFRFQNLSFSWPSFKWDIRQRKFRISSMCLQDPVHNDRWKMSASQHIESSAFSFASMVRFGPSAPASNRTLFKSVSSGLSDRRSAAAIAAPHWTRVAVIRFFVSFCWSAQPCSVVCLSLVEQGRASGHVDLVGWRIFRRQASTWILHLFADCFRTGFAWSVAPIRNYQQLEVGLYALRRVVAVAHSGPARGAHARLVRTGVRV